MIAGLEAFRPSRQLRLALGVVAIAAAMAGCGGGERQPAAPARDGAADASPAAAPPVGRKVRVRAADGKPLRARLAPAGRRAPAVIVLHLSDNARSAFNRLAGALHADGYTVLSLNGRFKFHTLRDVTEERDERAIARDVAGGVAYLRGSGAAAPDAVGVVAQSIGATGALLALADEPRAVDAAIAISPPDSQFVFELQADHAYAPRGVLFIADAREHINSQNLADGARESAVWKAPIAGHGYELLRDSRVRERLQAWLDERLR